MNIERLKDFRQAAYELLVRAKDATFELMDAVMTTRNASCLAEFSLSPLFNRQWSSVYEALQDTRPNRKKLMELYQKQLEQQVPATEHILVAIDHTAWGRPDAKTLKDRTHEYQRGTVVGQGYSTIAWIPEAGGSWALPLLHERISSESSPILQAASQLKLVCEQSVNPVLAVLDIVWFKYLRRFAVDHWYRFAKQRLHWTLPNLRTPEQSERWSDLMPLMSWQLWLARDLVAENRLPWQSATIDLTPGRVAQSMLSVLVDIGTPTKPPKSRGKSPGWQTGKVREAAPRYPTVKKRVSRRKKSSRLVV
ncbi:MAG: hypothetical protein HC849_05165 [Oscillatoriales cyanobacterium RU_3_3]|nr:hypothetical protein [Oscillatoriales cyanobacterium RU_3_3]NJR22411.1 hypothetical protein [Richelia sp. CSU_2_1]